MDCKEGQFDVVEAFNINLNAQYVSEMTYFDSGKSMYGYVILYRRDSNLN